MHKLNLLLLIVALASVAVADNGQARSARVDRLRRRFQRQIQQTNDGTRRSSGRRHRHETTTSTEPPTPSGDIDSLSSILDDKWKTLRDGSQIYLGEGRSALIVRRRQKVHTRNRGAMKNKTKTGKKASLSREQWRGRVRNKHARVFKIQQQVLSRLGLTRKPDLSKLPKNNTEVERIMKLFGESSNFSEANTDYNPHDTQTRSFHAKTVTSDCRAPRNCDETWFADGVLRLNFPFVINIEEDGDISTAILRLFVRNRQDGEKVETPKPSKGNRKTRHLDDESGLYDYDTEEDDDDDDDDFDVIRNLTDLNTISRNRLRVVVYKYKKPSRANKKEKKEVIHEQWLEKTHMGWLNVNIRDTVSEWANNPRRNYGIEVRVFDSDLRAIDPSDIFDIYNCSADSADTYNPPIVYEETSSSSNSSFTNETSTESTFPKIDILTMLSSKLNPRAKRETHPDTTCGKETVYVSLEEFGWRNVILQPRGFDAGFCTGSCSPLTELGDGYPMENDTKCCGPASHKPLLVLHYDDSGQLTVSILENFIVDSCQCRS